MLAPIALLAIALTGHQQPRQSMLQQIVPIPTGTNGYEDYLKAADMVAGTDLGNYLGWTPNKYAELKAATIEKTEDPSEAEIRRNQLAFYKRLEGKTLLEVRTEAARKYGRALDLLHIGNQKRVWDPRGNDLHAWTLFPEFASLKQLAKLADISAYVAFAEGRNKDGSRILLDTLQLGQNLEGATLISHLVGVAIESISLASYERFLPNLSRADAAMIENYAATSLSGQPKVIDAIKVERNSTVAVLQDALDAKEDVASMMMVDDDGGQLTAKFRALSPAAKQALLDRSITRLNDKLGAVIKKFYGPESGWITPARGLSGDPQDEEDANVAETPDSFAAYLVDSSAGALEQVGNAAARMRTQIRILGLNAAVLRYKWDNNKLPGKLEDAVAANQVEDPLSGKKFVFEAVGLSDFRIYSVGTKETGEIALKYRRAPAISNESGQVPPR